MPVVRCCLTGGRVGRQRSMNGEAQDLAAVRGEGHLTFERRLHHQPSTASAADLDTPLAQGTGQNQGSRRSQKIDTPTERILDRWSQPSHTTPSHELDSRGCS